MTKQLLELLSIERLKESKILLDQGCFSGAYYLAGYSLECALKVCIAKKINAHEIPDKKFINAIYVHNLNQLVQQADLERDRMNTETTNTDFGINWGIAKDWNEGSRYQLWTEAKATELYNAITSSQGGVLLWIQQYW
jgi:hypothetical protein